MRLPFLFFIVAILVRVFLQRRHTEDITPDVPPYLLKVMFATSPRESWKETIWHLISQANFPPTLRICVLLECSNLKDADLATLEPSLKSMVQVHCVKKCRNRDNYPRRVRRLKKRFVHEDEQLVVCMDVNCRLVPGWDILLMELMQDEPDSTILSMPATTRDNNKVPCFPTLRQRSTGAIAREKSRPFAGPLALLLVPSICWCAEFTVAKPKAYADWPVAGAPISALGNMPASKRFVVASLPLVEDDDRVESVYLDADEGEEGVRFGNHERIGLTRFEDDTENIRKFGSSQAAGLALHFHDDDSV